MSGREAPAPSLVPGAWVPAVAWVSAVARVPAVVWICLADLQISANLSP